MDHQDWNPVVFKKKTDQKKKTKETQKAVSQKGETAGIHVANHDFKKIMMQSRVQKKMTQQELAQSMNIPVTIIRDWESGKVAPSNRQIVILERVLGAKLPRSKKKKIPKD